MTKKTTTSGPKRAAGKRVVRSKAAKTAQIRARIDPAVKEAAEGILADLGLNPSTAITTFYRQIVLRRGLPFAVEVPNAATVAAIDDARNGRELIAAEDLEELIGKLLTKRDRTVDLAHLIAASPQFLAAVRRE